MDLLTMHPEVSEYYKHFLMPGHVLTALYEQLKGRPSGSKDNPEVFNSKAIWGTTIYQA
jgi:hypothetical protein